MRVRVRVPILIAAAIGAALYLTADKELSGPATIEDGDTIRVAGTTIRLRGVDAPETKQRCTKEGREYPCGLIATGALEQIIGGQPVTCAPIERDRYGRTVAICATGSGMDIGAAMVGQGWALAYRQYDTRYVSLEDEARQARRGLWAGAFTPPWDWRPNAR